jgi:hypothetical protein
MTEGVACCRAMPSSGRWHAIKPDVAFERHHRQQIIGESRSRGQGKRVAPLVDPNAPDKARCAVLDGAAYCYHPRNTAVKTACWN